MAKVSLQVVVDRKQVDQLQIDVNKLNGTTIRINAQEAAKDLGQAANSAKELNGNLQKTVEVFSADGKLTRETNTYKTALNQTTEVTKKLNKETGELGVSSTKVVTKQVSGEKQATQEVEKANEAVKKQGLLFDILGRSVGSFILRMAAYRAVYGGIALVTNGLRDALQTMKDVDKEMVAVQKVTGFSGSQMSAIEAESYSVASKYGTGAADYMASVADFARAGYMELAPALAELSVKTQIVGDTTAEVANQFLLSVDAAYQYHGSIEALTAVLDGADIINNKYATSVERIAEGLGIVAPVAAQMHVGVDELTAALGTITAVTQRSGRLLAA